MEIDQINITHASVNYEGKIKSLLKDNNLPSDDLGSESFKNFFIATNENNLAGVIGLEIFENLGLLRSLCVEGSYRNQRIASALFQNLILYANAQKIQELYLLTSTAEVFFNKRGFVTVDRSFVPDVIRMTSQFKDLCPISAICMKRNLNEEESFRIL